MPGLLSAFAQELSGSKVTEIQYLIDKEIEQLALILFYIQQNIGLDPPKSASATGSCSNLLAVVNLAGILAYSTLLLL